MKKTPIRILPFAPPSEPRRSDLPRLEAVGDVTIECRPTDRRAARRFYGDLIGLRERAHEIRADDDLCFSSQLLRLHVRVTPDALPSPNRRRALIRVASVPLTARRLLEEGYACQTFRGLGYFIRWALVLDPAGNLVELREERLF